MVNVNVLNHWILICLLKMAFMAKIKYYVIIWILIESVKPMLSTHCPGQCDCYDMKMECTRRIPDFIPDNVTSVILYDFNDFNFESTFNFNDSGWLNVKELSFNPGQSVLKTREDVYMTLNNRVFEGLVNLEHLQIACRCLRHIGKGTFRGLDKLRVLDLSNNRLTRASFVNGLNGDKILPNLEELVYSGISVSDYGEFNVDENFLDSVSKKPLTHLDLSRTKFSFSTDIELIKLFGSFSHLENLNISDSGSAVSNLLELLYSGQVTFPGFLKLRSLDLSYPATTNQIFQPGKTRYISFSPRLKEIHIKKFLTQPLKILYKNVTYINVTQMSVPSCSFLLSMNTPGGDSSYCVIGNVSLDTLDFSENSITYFDPRICKHLNRIKYFSLSQNALGAAFAEEGYMRSIIENLNKLEVLIVSGNDAYSLPYESFEKADLLQVLDLSNNKLESVMFNTEMLTALRHLDLRNNRIAVIDRPSLQRINYLIVQRVNIAANATVSTKISLHGNPISCSCENRHYFNWTIVYGINNTCLLEGNKHVIGQYILGHSYYLCKEGIVIAIYSLLATVEVVAVVIMVFIVLRIRRDAKLELKIRRGIQQYKENHENRQNMPVFLSFCCEDDDMVMDEIVPKLDEGLKKLLKTDARCVSTGYSDFRPGMSLANEIIRCVEECSVVVFFVTKAFCKKMWCRNEALIAYYEQKPTVLMIWEEFNLNLMPKYLYHHFHHNTRVHWVRENGQRVMKPGWEQLCESVVGLFVKE